MEFIDFRLQWDGSINRGELVEFFGVSTQQASSDLARYSEIAPGNLEYDKQRKTYRPTASYRPVLSRSDGAAYLGDIFGLVAGSLSAEESFVGWKPPCEVVRVPERPVEPEVLQSIVRAIRDRKDLRISYQSMRRPTKTERWISPHAMGHDGYRWHVRAYCWENRGFRDFVLSRIKSVHERRSTEVPTDADRDWNEYVEAVIAPRKELTADQRRAIADEYGMRNGRMKIRCRRALAFYALRQLRLDNATPNQSAAEQPLELLNRQDFADLIALAKKAPGPDTIHSSAGELTDERSEA